MGNQSQVAEDAILGFGTLLQLSTDGGTNYVTVAGVMDIEGPELATDDVEVTHQESPGETKEYIPGLLDGGTVSCDVVYLPGSPSDPPSPTGRGVHAGHAADAPGLVHEWRTRQIRDWRIIWPTTPGVEWRFKGYLSAFKPSGPMADKLTASITIRVAAAPTLA